MASWRTKHIDSPPLFPALVTEGNANDGCARSCASVLPWNS